MKNKNLEGWIQGIGLFGVIGSLIFVGVQVKQADEVAIMDVLDGTAERVLQGVRGSVLAVKPVTAVAARRAV